MRSQIPAAGERGFDINDENLGELAFAALADHAGAITIIDPRTGRVVKRVGRGADVEYTAQAYEIARVAAAYTGLETGVITERTLLSCDGGVEKVNVVDALARPCPRFFADLSRKISYPQFRRAAELIGFTYFALESPTWDQTLMKPVAARFPERVTPESFAAMVVSGAGIEARDLHFAQIASTLASGTTASERFAAWVMINARAITPPVRTLNPAVLAVIRRGLRQSVDEGEARAAASIDVTVAGKMGGGGGRAIFVSWASVTDARVAVVVYLKDAAPRDAAEVAGKFYALCFSPK
ncbi:MAG: hypothetical protein ACKV2V_26275 [Blastocatellia bacterium]